MSMYAVYVTYLDKIDEYITAELNLEWVISFFIDQFKDATGIYFYPADPIDSPFTFCRTTQYL